MMAELTRHRASSATPRGKFGKGTLYGQTSVKLELQRAKKM